MQRVGEIIHTKEGYLTYRFGGGNENLEIVGLFINEDFRRQGHATKLVKQVIDIAKDCACYSIYVFTRKKNEEARKFYEKLGFKCIVEIPDFYRKDEEHTGVGVIYLKKL